jgi:TRAP-type mannitol/chloroaromatic compound transport system permease large subunit
MAAFLAQNIAPIMFLALIVFLLLGYPAAFSLGAVGLLFFVIGVELSPFAEQNYHACSAAGKAEEICRQLRINLDWPLLQSLPERIFGVMNNETLLAIPFFTFMGLILERSGMAEDLLDTVGQLFGTVRGGLAYAVVFVGALLAATTGVVAASVISMGLISLPIMLRYGYDRRLATGVIAASGTLAQIIPPSLVLIVMADQLGKSVGDMYQGAFVPGLVLACIYASWIFIASIVFPKAAPGLPVEAIGFRQDNGSRGLPSLAVLSIASATFGWFIMRGTAFTGADYVVLTMAVSILFALAVAIVNWLVGLLTGFRFLSRLAQQVTFVMVPPLLLIFLVLGTIFIGVATPTEGGAMGALGAVLLAGFKRFIDKDPRRFNFTIVRSAAEATAKLSAFVVFILIGARIFSLTFYGVNGHEWVEHLLTSLPGGQVGFLVFVNIFVFILAFFLDFFELAFIIIPLLGPVASKIGCSADQLQQGLGGGNGCGIDLIWFGVILAVNMQTSFMHPPFGFALFYLRSVAPKEPYKDKVTGETMAPVTTGQIYWGAIPFVVIQCIMVALVIMFPRMVLHYKDTTPVVDPSKVDIRIQSPGFGKGAPGVPGGLQLPGGSPFGAPPPGLSGPPPGLSGPPPGLTGPPPGLSGPPPDLSTPPQIDPPAKK